MPGADDITRATLPNGITVLTRPNFSSLSVVINGYLNIGSLFDRTKNSVGSLFPSLMHGTASHNFQQLYDELESVGASLGFGAGVHSTGFSAHALAEDLPLLLKLLAETLHQPIFPKEQVERLRAQLMASLAIRAQDTQEMSSLTFDQIVYAGHHTAARMMATSRRSKIQVDDLVSFHRKHYGPQGMVMVVVGAVNPTQVIEQVANVSWDPGLTLVSPINRCLRPTVTPVLSQACIHPRENPG